MGLFPEASNSADSTTGANVSGDTSGGFTPNVRRRLFSAASDILAAVGSSKVASASAPKVSDRLSDSKTSASSPTKITTSTNAATVPSTSSSMQQLSTSWEFLRLVAQMYTICFYLQLTVYLLKVSCLLLTHYNSIFLRHVIKFIIIVALAFMI